MIPRKHAPMVDLISIRPSEPADAVALAALHAEAWRYAYRGIVPGIALERMVARRGAHWWAAVCREDPPLVVTFDERPVGYAAFGRCRMGGTPPLGEIHELYVRPECHGCGFGRALFESARDRLARRYPGGLVIWALAENALACRAYEGLGGRPRARAIERLGGARLEKIAYFWP